MLFEALEYFHNSSRCPQYLKDYGHLGEIIAIKARAKRCYSSWQSHLENSRLFIKQNLDLNPNIYGSSSVVIFGAGMCNDLDLHFLGDNFDKIILVDLFFLKSTREQLSKYPHIFFCELDVTNTMEKIYQLVNVNKDIGQFKTSLENFCQKNKTANVFNENPVKNLIANEDTSNIISLNLLSQIPLVFDSYFKKVFKSAYKSEDFDFFFKFLIKEHLQVLLTIEKMNKNVVLISDTHKFVSDKMGKEKGKESSLYNINLLQHLGKVKNKAKWYWDLAPHGELSQDYAMKLLVNAIKL